MKFFKKYYSSNNYGKMKFVLGDQKLVLDPK